MSVILSVIFEGYGMRELFVAYRTGNRTAWTEKAVWGGGGVIASVFFAYLMVRFFNRSRRL